MRLRTIEVRGEIRFSTRDLTDFDSHLREPWSQLGESRPAIPRCIDEYLKVECAAGCARCRSGGPLENAHIDAYAISRSHHPHNIIRLCKACHGSYDTGVISRIEIDALKQRLVDRVRASLRQGSDSRDGFPPPPLASVFVGRTHELSQLIDALRSQRTVLVTGLGGIGKSQLMLRALRKVSSGRPLYWLSVDQYGTRAELEDALNALVARLGVGSYTEASAQLDQHRACIVFDGVERLSGDFEGLTEIIDNLIASTSVTQIVVTSQVKLTEVRFDYELPLGGLSQAEATSMLADVPHDDQGEQGKEDVTALAEFSEGHPLTLRILAALIAHFGSPSEVLQRITINGATALQMPKRRSQTTQTSLNLCLKLAAENLDPQERRLMWICAHSPAGIYQHTIEANLVEVPDLGAAVAGLRRWELVQVERNGRLVFISMTSPVRAFAEAWLADHPVSNEHSLISGFVRSMLFHAAYIDGELIHGGRHYAGMQLMERAFPNILSAFDIASRAVQRDVTLREAISGYASVLMTFLFTSGRFRIGKQMMARAAQVAIDDGDTSDAIETLQQLHSLCLRSDDRLGAASALEEARKISQAASESDLIALRAMQALDAGERGAYREAERLGREAFDLYAAAGMRGTRAADQVLFTLARSLEFSDRPAEALPLYEEALIGTEARNDPINRGSILHHIGNCLAYAGENSRALETYVSAAQLFIELGAVEFISNSIGEAGLLAIDMEPIPELESIIGPELALHGLDDALRELIISGLKNESFNLHLAIVRLRKAAGSLVIVSMTSAREHIEGAARMLTEELVVPMSQGISTEISAPGVFLFNVCGLIDLLNLVSSHVDSRQPVTEDELAELADATSRAFVGPLHETMIKWLVLYLRVQRNYNVTADEILALLDNMNGEQA